MMMLSDICLSRTSEHKSRTERPRKTKIRTKVANVTRDSDTTFKVKRSKVKVTGGGAYCGGLPPIACSFRFANAASPCSVLLLSCSSAVVSYGHCRASLMGTSRCDSWVCGESVATGMDI